MLKKLSPTTRQTLSNTGWLLVDRMVRMGVGLVIGIWLARYLGPSGFGSLNFALSLVAILGSISALGLDGIVARNIIRDIAGASQILGTAFSLRILISVGLSILTILVCAFIQTDDGTTSILVAILSTTLIFQSFDVIDCYFQSQVKSKYTVWAKNGAFVLTAVQRLILIHLKAPLWSFAVAQVCETTLGAAGLLAAYRWQGDRLADWTAKRASAVRLLEQSWPVLFSGMAIMVYMRIDVLMLKVMQGDHAVGIYSTATRVSEVWYFISSAIVSSVTPAIIRAMNDSNVYYSRLQQLFSLMTLISLSIGSVIALCSPLIIRLLFTDTFAAAAPVLAVHVWASVFVFLGVAQSPWDLSQNQLTLAFYRTLAGAVTNVLLNLVLIPRYGAMGAAIATVISYAISAVLGNAFKKQTRKIFLMQVKSLYLAELWSSRVPLR